MTSLKHSGISALVPLGFWGLSADVLPFFRTVEAGGALDITPGTNI